MRETGAIAGVSVAHADATVDEIEAAGGDGVRATVSDLLAREGVEEAFAVQTCNRSEAYVVTDRTVDGTTALSTFAPDVRGGAVRRLDHEESLEHLMRVASGLESLVLGEDQIIGQLREAYEESKSAGGIGPVLKDAVTKALHVGERARTETEINEGVVSLGSAAVRLAAGEIDLTDGTAVVVGAGEMGTLAARTLDDTAVSEIVVANRTVPHAEFVVEEVDTPAEAVSLADLPAIIPDADLVVTATGSPDLVVHPSYVDGAGRVVCIDIAQPRDVDPAAGAREGVTVYDIDDLEDVTRRTRESRAEEARKVESIIDEELDRILRAYKRKRADDAISAMYAGADQVKARELDRAMSKLEAQGGLTDEQRETVEDLADALVGQLLAAPTRSLRDAAGEDDWETIRTALRLFDPEFTAEADGPEETDIADAAAGGPDALPDSVAEELDD
ncbi:glutamyl-tRNA reductase [Halorubrum distributum JCM 9100]|uniref:Glutamyl-tRNA reductase n=2 Tax=Halorubrum distributum TaxID=29283 RepID=M0ETS5_9EURY|nr:glutamyl-tRNA reductase [Halorubrum distributum]ELZ51191.1 glutamyl-tRNA reductase [Halorubrum distributum JCM 9100]ELZ53014.1 glutamyl-tRNA reductase [Halorubrum distributum JCM 10118]